MSKNSKKKHFNYSPTINRDEYLRTKK
ncbi:hypothetical protein [Bacteroides zhangwenhongii]